MTMRSVLMGVVSLGLILSSGCLRAANQAFHFPATARAHDTRADLASAARDLDMYVALCQSQDRAKLSRWVSPALESAYDSAAGGLVSVTEAGATGDPCGGARALAGMDRMVDVWVFPTDEAGALFVQYRLSSARGRGVSAEHLAFVVLQGTRIARLRILLAPLDRAARREPVATGLELLR